MMAEDEAKRKTTTYKQFDGMNSQDERYGCERTELFLLENIMRVGDGKLASVPGPTGTPVEVFPVPALFHFLLLETTPGYLLLEDFGKIDLGNA